MRKILIAALFAVTVPTIAMAQPSSQEKARLETECSQRPGSAACVELRNETSPTTTGTLPGPGNPNRPGSGSFGSSDGVAGSGAGGITPGGNPASSGGSPRSQ